MPKTKSNKVKKFRAVNIDELGDPGNNSALTSNTATSGKPPRTLKEQKNGKKGSKETPHTQDEGITLIEDSNLKTSNVSKVASSDAMRELPEIVSDEISHSSETTSDSTNEYSPPKNQTDVTYTKDSSRDNNMIIHKNKGGKYTKQNDSNNAFQKRQEKPNESSFLDTTVNTESIHVDNKSAQPNQWNVAVIPNIAPDCFQLEEKAKRPLNSNAPEFKPKSQCRSLNAQAENFSYSDTAKKSFSKQMESNYQHQQKPVENTRHDRGGRQNISYSDRAKKSNISKQMEPDCQERKGMENEIVRSHQQKTVENTHYDRDGRENVSHSHRANKSHVSKQMESDYQERKDIENEIVSSQHQKTVEITRYDRGGRENDAYLHRANKSHISKQIESNYQESTDTAIENEIVRSHQQKTVENTRFVRDGNDNYQKQKSDFKKSHSREFVNSSRHGPSNDYPQKDSKSNFHNKNRWSSNEGGRGGYSNSRDDGSERYGGKSKHFNQRERRPFEKRDSISTHNKHGEPVYSESDQNWDLECDAQPNLIGPLQNEATSNKQQNIESISRMNIRDVDNNSAIEIKMDTPIEVSPTPQKPRGLSDPRMEREAESKQQSNENWQKITSKKQRKPSPSPQIVDNSERTEEQNTSIQDDEDWDSQNVSNSENIEQYDSWNDMTIKQRKSYPESEPKHETERRSIGGRIERSSKEDFDRSYEKTDVEYREFNEKFRWNANFDFVKVIEKEQDLFEMPIDYCLGHCVAEDLRMGSGIAVTFKRDFKRLDDLLSQRQKQGGMAVLENNNRYIYYLVTKKLSNGKPTYETFWSSLKKMREHIVNHGVQKLAIPKIGCGLDRLDWDKVKYMIEFLFKDVNVEIVVCNFQKMEDTPQKDSLSTKLVYHHEPLKDIDQYTIILYFSTKDGHVSKEMEELDTKFNFLPSFRRSFWNFGMPIRHNIRNYILYGCIVREKLKEPFDFKSFATCLFEITKNNRKDLYEYVALEQVYDENDDLLNEKVITLLRNCLKKVDIYICSGKTPEEQ